MASENLQKALKIISDRNIQAKLVAQQRYSDILIEIPRVRAIYQELAKTCSKLSNVVFANNSGAENASDKINQIKIENLNLQKELGLILQQNNYDINYLEPQYYCNKCEDTAFISGNKCSCLKELITEISVRDFNNSMNFSPLKFDTFSLDYYSEDIDLRTGISCKKTMGDILEFCKQYSEKFHENSPSVLMMGETGLGKTHLSLSIANTIMLKGYTAMYSSSLDLFRILQNEYFGKSDVNRNTMNTILEADLVIIDDLGAEFDSAFNCSSLYNIVNSRLNVNKPTIINTNLVPSELEKRYTKRVASRLMTLYKCLKFTGKDVRQIKLRNNEY